MREAAVDEIAEMARLHVRSAAMQMDALSRRAAELLGRIEENPALLEEVALRELFRMVLAAASAIRGIPNLERVSRAAPRMEAFPTFVATSSPPPPSLLDDAKEAAAAWLALREAGVVPAEVELG